MTQDNKAVVRRMFEVMNTRDVEALDQVLGPTVDGGWMGADRESVKAFMQAMLQAFPDLSITVEDLVAEGDKVAARISASGTHAGEFGGLPPTGKRFQDVPEMDFLRVRDGRIVEVRTVYDQVAFLQQVGLMPAE